MNCWTLRKVKKSEEGKAEISPQKNKNRDIAEKGGGCFNLAAIGLMMPTPQPPNFDPPTNLIQNVLDPPLIFCFNDLDPSKSFN